MNGTVAQAVALVCHGNAALAGLRAPPLFPDTSTCRFCESVRFVRFRRRLLRAPAEDEVAATPDDWFGRLKEEGCSGLTLAYFPSANPELSDRMSSGFAGGGGSWVVITTGQDGRATGWLARWEVGDEAATDQRIWRVTYGEAIAGEPPQVEGGLDEAAAALLFALGEAREFSLAAAESAFVPAFEQAMGYLSGGPARLAEELKDLSPPGLLEGPALSVLGACQAGWVLGGMGSWNDLGFEGDTQLRYEAVSDHLYEALTMAIVAATNESAAAVR